MKNASALRLVLIASAFTASTAAPRAAEVTYDRLMHPEPQNWLMNHHDYSSQRFSPLESINKSNIKNLKLKFAVALGGKAANESLEATPLVEDGFMYVTDGWGAVYKIDVRSGSAGHIVWKMDPGQGRLDRNRGVALWGNLVISVTSQDARVVATDKETGKIVWEKDLRDQPDIELDAAPLALKDSIIIGASGGDRGLRDWIASLDARTGELQWKTYSIPAPGEPGSETWKDKVNAWQSGGGAFYVTGAYDPATNLTYWGTGNPVPGYDAARRPGDNLYTSSVLALNAASGKINWYFQYTPNDNRDYDETGTHILIDTKINGEDRKVVSHAGRNGFEYFLDRQNGQFLKAVQHVDQVTWTKGIDPKTGKPIEYDPGKDFQVYADGPDVNNDKVRRRVCPDTAGGTNYWPASYSQRTRLIYIPALESCSAVAPDYSMHVKGNFTGGTTGGAPGSGNTSSIVALDPSTGAIKMRKVLPYPNFAGVLSTGGGIIFTALLDGTIVALDDETLDELWSVNVGTGFNAPPMTYAVDGKQYIAIASGLFNNARNRLNRLPDLKGMSSATMVFVFGL
jgi:alcohol dehydrogenase (cytochrome c)